MRGKESSMADIKSNDGKTPRWAGSGSLRIPQDTKHVNDTSDPSAVEAKALSAQLASADEQPRQAGSHRIRLVEAEAVEAEGDPGLVVAEEPSTDGAAAKKPREFKIHPLPGRIVPWWRRRR
jgi:hypothetical protein